MFCQTSDWTVCTCTSACTWSVLGGPFRVSKKNCFANSFTWDIQTFISFVKIFSVIFCYSVTRKQSHWISVKHVFKTIKICVNNVHSWTHNERTSWRIWGLGAWIFHELSSPCCLNLDICDELRAVHTFNFPTDNMTSKCCIPVSHVCAVVLVASWLSRSGKQGPWHTQLTNF